MPPGVLNAHFFQVFNTISFSIVLGTPIILFFKNLNVGATILGIVAALNPLLNILQIPAAKYLDRVGYRSFVLRGWATRSIFIVGMALVASCPDWLSRTWRILLMLLMLTAFNAARGISACGFLPWMTHLIPENVRGRFLARDQMASAVAMLATMILTAVYLCQTTSRYAFPIMFFVSYGAALVSLIYLRRIPDVPITDADKSGGPIPWKEMLLHQPFLKLMFYNGLMYAVFAASTIFWIPLLRDHHQASNAMILGMQALTSGVAAICLFVFGRLIDHVGSRPLLGLSGLTYLVHFTGWCALAAHWLPFNLNTVLLLQVTVGLGGSLFGLANTRLLMSTVPEMGRSHFFAMFSVITNLILGSLPVLWGAGLDSLSGWHLAWQGWEWNPYSLLYVILMILTLCGLMSLRRLTEPRAMTTDVFLQELVLKTPSRALARLLLRRPF